MKTEDSKGTAHLIKPASSWYINDKPVASRILHNSGVRMNRYNKLAESAKQFASMKDAGWFTAGASIDRDELIARLKVSVMLEPDETDNEFSYWLAYLFRSSDQGIYQEAAIAIAVHYRHNHHLSEFLKEYLKLHDLSMDKPVTLSSRRSSRRIAILMAADHALETEVRIPVIKRRTDGLYELTDLNTLLRIYALVLQDESVTDKLKKEAASILESVPANAGNLNRITGMRVYELLDVMKDEGLAENLICEMIGEFPAMNNMSRHLMLLDAIDEVTNYFALSPDRAESLVKKFTEQGDDFTACWLWCRMFVMAARGSGNKNPLSSAAEPDEACWNRAAARNPVIRIMRAASDSSFRYKAGLGGDGSADRLRLVRHIWSELKDDSTWDPLPPTDQALLAFLILDVCRYAESSEAIRLAQLFSENLSQGRISAIGYAYLMILHKTESDIPYLDSTIIHSFESDEVLFRILALKKRSIPVYDLADAFEHRMRLMLMRSDDDFDPGLFLYKMSCIRPVAEFGRYMTELMHNRTYYRGDRSEVPVQLMVEWLLNSVKPDAKSVDLIKKHSPFIKKLDAVRSEYDGFKPEEIAIIPALDLLIELLEYNPAGEDSKGEGLIIRLIRQTSGSRETGLLQEVAQHASAVKDRIAVLKPQKAAPIQITSKAADQIIEILGQLEKNLKPYLAETEWQVFKQLQHRVISLMRQYQEMLRRLAAQLENSGRVMGTVLKENVVRLYSTLHMIPDGEIRQYLTVYLTVSLMEQAEKGKGRLVQDKVEKSAGVADGWTRRLELMKLLLSKEVKAHTTGSYLEDSLAELWNELAQAAMAEGYEHRVYRLIDTQALEPVYSSESCADMLNTARTWYLDRYNITKAYRISRIVDKHSNWSLKYQSLRLNTFAGNYGSIWVSLLIGAILMLDFGDAWAEMADIGDIRGIWLTFLLSISGAFAYVYTNLSARVKHAPGDSRAANQASWLMRSLFFISICMVYSFAVAGALWWLLSGTDEVVHGDGAILHISVWASFALFIGVFFGLIARRN